MDSKLTPMMKQYMEMKRKYQDEILFFRMGDFYEMFFEDAHIASKILDIALTSRQNDIPMCGIPYHAADNYLARLIKAGKRVAICEQLETVPSSGPIVKREVVRVVTPGSVIEFGDVDSKTSLYIAAISRGDKGYGLAYVDLSTAEFRVTEIKEWGKLLDELGRISPAELLIPENDDLSGRRDLSPYRTEIISKDAFDERVESWEATRDRLEEFFQVRGLL